MSGENLWYSNPARALCEASLQQARARQQQLTKPSGALGQLESLAVHIAGLQANASPQIGKASIDIFAADHGVAVEGVSAYPQAVTAEMIRNFARGGAAISVLAREQGLPMAVHNLGTVTDLEDLPLVTHYRLGKGTANFLHEPAMTREGLQLALAVGQQVALQRAVEGIDLTIAGEMGIGNTTSASALACALSGFPAEILVGPGTGLNAEGISRKITVVEQALAFHQLSGQSPLAQLQAVGGFEIAAITGFFISCAQQGIIVLVDGFICSVAAQLAMRINPSVRPWLLLSHLSAEPGHSIVAENFIFKPLLNLGLRLGEGSGAALALPLVKHACQLQSGMATFAEAAVSTASNGLSS